MLGSLIQVTRIRHEKAGIQSEIQLYASSRQLAPKRAERHIREHWFVENHFHKSLDVCLKEDQERKSKFAKFRAVMNMALHNIFTIHKTAGWRVEMIKNAAHFKNLLQYKCVGR